MSKKNLIRKARNQLNSVREDGLRRQLHAVKGGIKRSSGGHHHNNPTTTSTPGFKFSDIDNTDMDDFDWLETSDSNNDSKLTASTGPEGEPPRDTTRPTSDYSSSYSSLDSSYSDNSHTLSSSTDDTSSIATIDLLDETPSIQEPPLPIQRDDPLPVQRNDGISGSGGLAWESSSSSSKSPSLFDDGPSLVDTDDLFTNTKSSDPLFDPSPLVPDHTVDDLFQTPSLDDTSADVHDDPMVDDDSNNGDNALEIVEESLETTPLNHVDDVTIVEDIETEPIEDCPGIDKQATNESQNPKILENEVPIDEALSTKVHTDEILDEDKLPTNEDEVPTNEVLEDLIVNKSLNDSEDSDDDDLFKSVTNQLLVPSSHEVAQLGESSIETKSDLNSSFSSNLAMSETSEDPLSLMSHDLDNESDDEFTTGKLESSHHDNNDDMAAKNDTLLQMNEGYFTNHTPTLNHKSSYTPVSESNSKPHPSVPHPSTPPKSSPLLIHKSLKDSPRTQMKKNSSGKSVPVVPPRPTVSKRTMSCPDPDTVSLVSNVSSVSAYSANEVFNRRGILDEEGGSVNSSIMSTGSTQGGPVKPWLLDSIDESPVHTSSQPLQSTDDNSGGGYTVFILLFTWLILYVYYSLNPFVYLAGFMAGFFTFYITIGTAFYWYVQYSEREKERRESANKKVELPAMEDLPKTIDTDFESSRILESKKFGMVHQYYPTTHHPSQRVNTRVKLYDDFLMEIRYWSEVHTSEGLVGKEVVITKDLRTCSILIVPEEVAQNRKRRWSKKFPISVSWDKTDDSSYTQAFLFPFTSREKEEWFRRMRSAQEGKLYDDIVREQTVFFRYMGKYMPHSTSPIQEPAQPHNTKPHKRSTTDSKSHIGQRTRSSNHTHKHKLASEPVRFSLTSNEEDNIDNVSISSNDTASVISIQKDVRLPHNKQSTTTTGPSSSNLRLSSSLNYGWMNAGLARLAWDMWHEERWLKWVQSRVQRKLIRIKTPSFMEPLKVTAVDMGMDMPIIKRPFKNPKLDSRGIWVYMEVEYRGTFNMTIETKLKLEPKLFGINNSMHFNRGSESPPPSNSSSPVPDHLGNKPHPYHKSRLSRLRVNAGDPEEELSSGSDDEESMSSQVTRSMEEKLPHDLEQQGIPVYSSSQDDSGLGTSSSSSSVTSSNEFDTTTGPKGRKEKILTNMVSRLQKMATKSKIVAKAAEKASSYPMILSVEVKSLKGFLVLNMAPPPSDALWFGFTVNPVLDLVAKPKLGHREVTLSYVTDWIEKKLCDVLEKKLVYPNMEDLVIPVLNSGLPEDKLIDLMSPPS